MSLSLTNYADGPKKDLDKPGELWEFGTEISGCEIYIKLKITEIDGEKIVKCISFHEADRPLNYPFR